MQVALTIAGSDPAGGAGVQGDLRAFFARGVHGLSVLTAIIAQATRGVRAVWPVTPEQARAQLEVLLADVTPHAAKTGALATGAIAREVAGVLEACEFPMVIDPVLASSSGARLLDDLGLEVLRERLMPRATLITPNAPELAILLGDASPARDVEGLVRGAERLRAMGARAVLAKGGHLPGDPVDVLVDSTGQRTFAGERLQSRCTRGTGCTLSAAITADLAKGSALAEAVEAARALVRRAMALGEPIGEGESPLNVLGAARSTGEPPDAMLRR